MSTREQHLKVPPRPKMGTSRTSSDTSSPKPPQKNSTEAKSPRIPDKSPPMTRAAQTASSDAKKSWLPARTARHSKDPNQPPNKAPPLPPSRGLTCAILSKDDLNIDEKTWLFSPVNITKINPDLSAKGLEERVRLLQKWQHPSIAQFFGVCLEPEVLIVTEAGLTLNEYLATTQSGYREKTAMALELATGLYFLHAQGVMHQDLRPQNIIITARGQAKLTEVGVSKAKSLDLASEVKDFGSILWFLFSQQAPVPSDTLDQYPELPKKFAELIKACWSSSPSKRPEWSSVIEQLQDCRTILAYTPKELCEFGQQFEHERDYESAYDAYLFSAKAGYFYGQSRLATLFLEGKGCKQDLKQAFFWMLESAKQGEHTRAIYTVAMMYEKGDGTPPNINEAIFWYRKAAEKGHEAARSALARFESEVAEVGAGIPYFSTIPSEHSQFIRKLGEGGLGVVYEVIWNPLGTARFKVVVKQLKDPTLSKTALAEFVNEVKNQIRLDHPGIVKMYGVTQPHGMVMEYMELGPLHDYLKSKTQSEFSWTIRLQMALNLAKALEYLHSMNIVHRDLKSPNIVVGQGEVAKITDFGLSKVKDESKTHSVAKGSLTVIEGSYPWLAPEVLKLLVAASKSADIYAFAIILWELAALELPYSGLRHDRGKLTEFVLGDGREGFSDERTPGVPEGFRELVEEGWDSEPRRRPTAKQLVLRLSNLTLVPTLFAPETKAVESQQPGRKRGGTCIETTAFIATATKVSSN